MWKVVLWLNVVWSLYPVEASDEPSFEFELRYGVDLMEPRNKTTYLNNNLTLMDQKTIRGEPHIWEGTSEDIGKVWQKPGLKRQYLRIRDFEKDARLQILQKSVKYDEKTRCVFGITMIVKCNHCVCMGGQLYVCTVRECGPDKKKKKGKDVAYVPKSRCIEGESIRSFDTCNTCYCGGGQVMCTRKKCLGGGQNLTQPECIPGKRIQSADNCNTCTCNTRGIIVCTAKTCGPALSEHNDKQVCIPNTWYSPSGNRRCKQCYCINGKMAFCYLDFCFTKITKRKCRKDYSIQNKCTTCKCEANRVWKCQTKNIDKTCSYNDLIPEQLHHYNVTTFHRRKMFFSRFPSRPPTLPEAFYELLKTTGKTKRTTKVTRITKQDYDRTTGLELENEIPEISFSGESKPDSGDNMFPEYIESSREPEDNNRGGRGRFPPGNSSGIVPEKTSPDNYSIYSLGSHGGRLFCSTGQFFTLGSDRTCHGCFCTPTNEWKCWSIKNACRSSDPCNPGKMKRNSVAPCSVCYCGADRKNYCATDEMCSYSIQPSKCEAIACLNYCASTNANFGVCHQDKCVCVN